MDAEGIDQAVLYPSIGLYAWAITDPAAAVSVAKAYNDWLASYCAADTSRLFGAAMLPVQDPAAAVAEMQRASRDARIHRRVRPARTRAWAGRCRTLLTNRSGPPPRSSASTIGVHEGSSVIVPTLGSDRPFNPLVLHAISHSFEEMLAFAQLVAFGVLERHPSLRIVFLESGGGWAPFWTAASRRAGGDLRRFLPGDAAATERVLRHGSAGSATRWTSRRSPALLPFIGEERVVWGSDYPHHDATFPGAVAALRRNDRRLSGRSSERRFSVQNAAALYRLPAALRGRRRCRSAVLRRRHLAATPTRSALCSGPAQSSPPRGKTFKGSDEIARFYAEGAFSFDDLAPDPGPLDIDLDVNGERVVVDLELSIDGTVIPLRDVFEMAGDRIAKLEIMTLQFGPAGGGGGGQAGLAGPSETRAERCSPTSCAK